ncbi:MAG TPA: flagellar basal-body MS-ring/collar protein FliF [Dissulfurispiraceae bacterium]|nr:flagellar basal-body MS-ring/collar protein FliF [Dissulfurispiraceae bacterium]
MALNDIVDRFIAWPLKNKLALLSVVAICIAIISGMVMWSQKVDYQVLFSNISQEDTGQVIAKLKEMKVPYQVEGNAVSVPSDRVYELRLDLASQGIPQGGGVGFEIFDKNQFGVTEFVQRLNYVRALQGELARTIRTLSEVDQARVHIAIPEKSIFSEKEERPTASVVVRLKGGRTLNQGQIGGIVHLVASSVEGLPPQNVTVIDNMGNLLSKPSDGSDMVADAKQLEYQRGVDKEYESKLQSMLEGIVGRGKAIVRVSSKLDFSKVERTEEKFDPDTIAVRSENRNAEKSVGSAQGGIPGVASNQPGQQPAPAPAAAPSASQKQTESINYEVSRVVSKIIEARGVVKSISVAVLVDGTYQKGQGTQKGAFVPRNEQEMKKYDDIVKAAIGFDKNRGDQVIVENVPFETAAFEEMAAEKTDYLRLGMSLLKYIIPIGVVLLLFMLVIKPLLKTLSAPITYKAPEGAATYGMPGIPGVIGGGGAQPAPPTSEEAARERALGIVGTNPKQAAGVVKEWLQE